MIGVRLINGLGEPVSNGGRVMKNVTGYDLVKLMAGSFGTLGVLTEISFKLVPAPEKTVTVCAEGIGFEMAVKAFSTALGSSCEPTGAAFLPQDGKNGLALLRIEGLEQSVDHRVTGLCTLLSEIAEWQLIEGDGSAALWKRARDVEDFAGSADPVWRVSVKPTDGPILVEKLNHAGDIAFVADWAGGLIWLSARNLDDSASDGLQRIHARIQSESAGLEHLQCRTRRNRSSNQRRMASQPGRMRA